MATGVHNSILTAARTILAGLTLSGIDAANVKIRKLPSVREVIDTLPCVLVSPSDTPERIEPLSFEDGAKHRVVYAVDVVVVAADSADFSTNLSTYLRWREQVRRALDQPTLAAVAPVFDVDVEPFSPLDREQLSKLYAYSGLSFRFHCVEPGGDA